MPWSCPASRVTTQRLRPPATITPLAAPAARVSIADLLP
jgi:hypothetical protein